MVRIRDLSSVRVDRVEFPSASGIVRGLVYSGGQSATCVVLAHGYSSSKHNLDPLAFYLATEGIRSLALDFQGHKLGCSSLPLRQESDLCRNVLDAVAFARNIPEVRTIVSAGHSMGAAASIGAAVESREIDAVIAMCTALGRSQSLQGPTMLGGLRNRSCYVDGPSPEELTQAMDRYTVRINEVAPRPMLVDCRKQGCDRRTVGGASAVRCGGRAQDVRGRRRNPHRLRRAGKICHRALAAGARLLAPAVERLTAMNSLGGKMSVSILKRVVPFGAVAVLVLLVAAWSTSNLDRSSAANAAQGSPVPTVSVTTLPAMPGPATSSATQTPFPMQTVAPLTATPNPLTLPIAPPLGVSYIQVVGDVANPLTLTLKDLEGMRPASLTLRFHTYTGVPLIDVINRAGLRFSTSPQMLMRKYVYIQGLNGQSATISFPEFTKEFNSQLILLAYLVDLRPVVGPGFVTLVVQDDKSTIRYINVARIVVGEPLQQM